MDNDFDRTEEIQSLQSNFHPYSLRHVIAFCMQVLVIWQKRQRALVAQAKQGTRPIDVVPLLRPMSTTIPLKTRWEVGEMAPEAMIHHVVNIFEEIREVRRENRILEEAIGNVG